jgi:hypothetical protein
MHQVAIQNQLLKGNVTTSTCFTHAETINKSNIGTRIKHSKPYMAFCSCWVLMNVGAVEHHPTKACQMIHLIWQVVLMRLGLSTSCPSDGVFMPAQRKLV